jgi:hypothetical protein
MGNKYAIACNVLCTVFGINDDLGVFAVNDSGIANNDMRENTRKRFYVDVADSNVPSDSDPS